MSKTKLAAGCVLLLFLFLGGCCPEDQCKSKYGMIDPGDCPVPAKVDCMEQHGMVELSESLCDEEYPCNEAGQSRVGGPFPPDGPVIVLEPDSDAPDELSWTVDGDEQAEGDSIFPACELRVDFIGTQLLEFKYYEAQDPVAYAATHVVVSNEENGREIHILRTSGNKVQWVVKHNAPLCVATSTSTYQAGKVPTEYIGLKSTEFYHVSSTGDKKKIAKVKIRVKMS